MNRHADFSSPESSVPRISRFVLERADNPHDVVFKVFSCNHAGTRLTVRQIATGLRRTHQCLRCGAAVSGKLISAEDRIKQLENLPLFDESMPKRWNESKHAAATLASNIRLEKLQQKQDNETRQWWEWYNQYTQSPQWRKRRERVFERDGYRCQACLENDATEIHHLTYAHVGHEPLFDLISVCHACHEAITEMDRKRREGNS